MTQESRFQLEKKVVGLLRKAISRMRPYGLKAIRLTREVYNMVFQDGERWRERYDLDMLAYEPLFLRGYEFGERILLIPDCERLEFVF